jgi:nitrite reductase/ring-hydroxylating ferredoxin subunit
VKVVSPAEVHIRLVGSCDGCSFSEATVRMGIETAIKEVLPTLEVLKVVEARKPQTPVNVAASPFAARPWVDAGPLEAVHEGRVVAVELTGASVLLTRVRGELKAYPNACVHLGMPLDGGTVANGVLTCPYHAFQYQLETGECLTAPEVQLAPWPVRALSDRVQVQVPA